MSENKTIANRLPEKLAQLRRYFQYSQADVASKLNVSVSDYMNWENGNSICTIAQLKQLSRLFQVNMQDLADNTKDIAMPRLDTADDSVQIPFQNLRTAMNDTAADTVNMETTDFADRIMPVKGALPPRDGLPQEDAAEAEPAEEDAEATKIMNTDEFAPTRMNKIVDDTQSLPDEEEDEEEEEEEEAPKPVRRKPARAKQKPGLFANLSKKTLIILIAVVLAAIGLIVFLMTRGNSGSGTSAAGSKVSVSSTNRLALAEKFSMYLDDKGSLSTWGSMVSKDSYTDLAQVSARGQFALGLKKDGTVVCAGGGTACEVTDWNDITMIAAGESHSVGLKSDGTVLCAGGDSACGGVKDWTDIASVYAGDGITAGITKSGGLKLAGTVSSSTKLEALTNVKSVSIGDSEIEVLTSDGKVTCYAIGTASTSNTSTWTGISAVADGDTFAAGLKSDGTVSIVTTDDAMKTAVEKWKNVKFIAARNSTLIAITSDGKMYGTGDNASSQYENTADASASASAEASASASAAVMKLTTPANVKFNVTASNLAISWDAVSNASYYIVTVSTPTETQIKSAKNSASISADKLTNGTSYTVKITAYPKDSSSYAASDTLSVNYTYSATSIKLATPANLKASSADNGLQLTWSSVSNATAYTVTFTAGSTVAASWSTGDTTTVYSEAVKGTSYTCTVVATSTDTKYGSSDAATATITYSPTAKYTLTINYVYTDGSKAADSVVKTLVSGDAYNVDSPVISGYTATKTNVSGTITANVNETIVYNVTITPLAAPELIVKHDDATGNWIISWKAVDNAGSYAATITDASGTAESLTVDGTSVTVTSAGKSGSYTVTVTATPSDSSKYTASSATQQISF